MRVHAGRTKQDDALAHAMSKLAKEQKAARKKRKGDGDESSSEPEDDGKGFDYSSSMKQYGLANIPSIHTQKTKRIEDNAKKYKKASGKQRLHLAPGGVMEYAPQWMGDKPPKSLRAEQMTHAHFVAGWWSRAFTQVAAQGAAESETLSFESLLVEFLNVNKVAVEQGTKVAWEYDRALWDKTVERASRRDSALDVTKEFTVVDENQLTAVQKKVQSWSATAGPKGGNPTSNGKGSGGVFPAKGKEGGKGDGFLFGKSGSWKQGGGKGSDWKSSAKSSKEGSKAKGKDRKK